MSAYSIHYFYNDCHKVDNFPAHATIDWFIGWLCGYQPQMAQVYKKNSVKQRKSEEKIGLHHLDN